LFCAKKQHHSLPLYLQDINLQCAIMLCLLSHQHVNMRRGAVVLIFG